MTDADPLRAGRPSEPTFHPKLLGYSMVWQTYRTEAGHAQVSIQLQDPAPLLDALQNVLAGIEAERLLHKVSKAGRWL